MHNLEAVHLKKIAVVYWRSVSLPWADVIGWQERPDRWPLLVHRGQFGSTMFSRPLTGIKDTFRLLKDAEQVL